MKQIRKNAFVKVSGDLVTRRDVIKWLEGLAQTHFAVICVGGGSQINKEFERRKIKIDFGPLGRRNKTFRERQLSRNILEKNQLKVQNRLARMGITAVVIIPVLEIGSVLCHVNGDIFVRAAYIGFDDLFVVTYEGRKVEKEKDFADLRRIRVIGFPEKLVPKRKRKNHPSAG